MMMRYYYFLYLALSISANYLKIEALQAKIRELRSLKRIKKESTVILVPAPGEVIEISD